jgi:hypothetical protein
MKKKNEANPAIDDRENSARIAHGLRQCVVRGSADRRTLDPKIGFMEYGRGGR